VKRQRFFHAQQDAAAKAERQKRSMAAPDMFSFCALRAIQAMRSGLQVMVAAVLQQQDAVAEVSANDEVEGVSSHLQTRLS
jgi:hypothetical protein